MNAITFLLKQHEKIRDLFTKISEEQDFKSKKELFDKLCNFIIHHENIEQKIWYPRFKDSKTLDHTVKHLISEEKHAERAIKKFETIQTSEEWEKNFLKFKTNVEEHATEEEQKLFPVIAKTLSKEELEEIGEEMSEF